MAKDPFEELIVEETLDEEILDKETLDEEIMLFDGLTRVYFSEIR